MANRDQYNKRGNSRNDRSPSGPRVGSVRRNVPAAVRDDAPRGRSNYSAYAPKDRFERSDRRDDRRDNRRFDDKPKFDKKPRFDDKPRFDKKNGRDDRRDNRRFDDKPRFDKNPRFDDKPRFDRKNGRDDRRDNRRFDDKPKFDKKPRFDDKPRFDSKPRFDDKPRFDSKPRFEDQPSFAKKPRFDDMPANPFFDDEDLAAAAAYDSWDDESFDGEEANFDALERFDADNDADDRLDDEEDMSEDNVIAGRNPIREALRSGHDIEKLLVARGEKTGSAREIIAMARENRVVVQEVDRARLDAIYPGHQGMIAFVSAARYSEMDDIFELAASRGEDPFIIALDGITDPHNLGAILRTAECCGAHGVIVPRRRGVGLTPAAVKAAAGAQEYVKVVRVVNMARTLEDLKEQGVWVYGADMDGENAFSTDFSGPAALVIGSEGSGVSEHVLSICDRKVALPMKGSISSLNASVAAGVLMYQVMHSRSHE